MSGKVRMGARTSRAKIAVSQRLLENVIKQVEIAVDEAESILEKVDFFCWETVGQGLKIPSSFQRLEQLMSKLQGLLEQEIGLEPVRVDHDRRRKKRK